MGNIWEIPSRFIAGKLKKTSGISIAMFDYPKSDIIWWLSHLLNDSIGIVIPVVGQRAVIKTLCSFVKTGWFIEIR